MQWALSDMHIFLATLFRCQLIYNIIGISKNNLVIVTCSAIMELDDAELLIFCLSFPKAMITSMYYHTWILLYSILFIHLHIEYWAHAFPVLFLNKQTKRILNTHNTVRFSFVVVLSHVSGWPQTPNVARPVISDPFAFSFWVWGS